MYHLGVCGCGAGCVGGGPGTLVAPLSWRSRAVGPKGPRPSIWISQDPAPERRETRGEAQRLTERSPQVSVRTGQHGAPAPLLGGCGVSTCAHQPQPGAEDSERPRLSRDRRRRVPDSVPHGPAEQISERARRSGLLSRHLPASQPKARVCAETRKCPAPRTPKS